MTRKPDKVIEEAQIAARALRDIIEKSPDKVVLNGKTYLRFEDWLLCGRFWGYTVQEDGDPTPVTMGDAQGFKASAIALDRAGVVRSRATAYCMNDEENWGERPKYAWCYVTRDGEMSIEDPGKENIVWEDNPKKAGGKRPKKIRQQVGTEKVPMFQLASMAQTRASAKVLRNILAWVVVLAGYQPTPAEEMTGKRDAADDAGESNGAGGAVASGEAKEVRRPFVAVKVAHMKAGKDGALLAVKVEGGSAKGSEIVAVVPSKAAEIGLKIGDVASFDTVQRPGPKGKKYWLVVAIKDLKPAQGPTPRQGTKQDIDSMKPGEANAGHGNENTQQRPAEAKQAKEAAKPAEAIPAAPAFKEVHRNLLLGSGENVKKQAVVWTQVRGILAAVSEIKKTGKGGQYIFIVLQRLPDVHEADNWKKPRHDTFTCWHRSLFAAAHAAKRGEEIVLEFEQEITKDGGPYAGQVNQIVEDIVFVGGRYYVGGELQEKSKVGELFDEAAQ